MASDFLVRIALIGFIPIGAAFFAFMPAARAFALVYVVGLLALPYPIFTSYGTTGMLYYSHSIYLDNFTACSAAAVLGTLMFHRHIFAEYRFDWLDLAYPLVLLGMLATAMTNRLGSYGGAYDGVSIMTANLLRYLPLLFLSKAYIRTMGDMMEVLRAIIGGAFIYGLLGVVEWRLSPIFSLDLYGYYQHGFTALSRWNHFRPVMLMKNALQYAFFMAASTLAVFWLWQAKLFKPLWGVVPAPLVLFGTAVGLFVSMTYGAYAAAILGFGLFGLSKVVRSRWLLWVFPVGALLWMFGRYTQVIHTGWMVSAVRNLSANRAQSLGYRFAAENKYVANAHMSVLFGRGGFGRAFQVGRQSMPVAVDSFWLIESATYGLVGLVARLLLWMAGIFAAWRLWNRVPLNIRPVLLLVASILGLSLVDCCVNANLIELFLILGAGLLAIADRARYLPANKPASRAVAPLRVTSAVPAAAANAANA